MTPARWTSPFLGAMTLEHWELATPLHKAFQVFAHNAQSGIKSSTFFEDGSAILFYQDTHALHQLPWPVARRNAHSPVDLTLTPLDTARVVDALAQKPADELSFWQTQTTRLSNGWLNNLSLNSAGLLNMIGALVTNALQQSCRINIVLHDSKACFLPHPHFLAPSLSITCVDRDTPLFVREFNENLQDILVKNWPAYMPILSNTWKHRDAPTTGPVVDSTLANFTVSSAYVPMSAHEAMEIQTKLETLVSNLHLYYHTPTPAKNNLP